METKEENIDLFKLFSNYCYKKYRVIADKNNNEKKNIYELEKAINESKILLNKNRNIINLISEKYNLKKLEETDFD